VYSLLRIKQFTSKECKTEYNRNVEKNNYSNNLIKKKKNVNIYTITPIETVSNRVLEKGNVYNAVYF